MEGVCWYVHWFMSTIQVHVLTGMCFIRRNWLESQRVGHCDLITSIQQILRTKSRQALVRLCLKSDPFPCILFVNMIFFPHLVALLVSNRAGIPETPRDVLCSRL